ncbi:MOSC domain-containing protein [Roseobacter sp. HKCCA0434]|uniref:MOSC domain-containing protein n=1 Tax=Roseobacter sp. HKCCA0434 TaxID=3079297 RepID=UPI002905C174|nr:MOSC domain-containing protein [Roseobacter sp. HKCCA0434]
MPVLQATEITGRVTWLGRVAHRPTDMRAEAVTRVDATFAGIEGEYHSGLIRESCSRVKTQYPVGTPIRNVRQISILSAEELAATAAALDLDSLAPELVGANIVLEGIPDFTLIPPSSRLIFAQGASLVVDMENAPCQWPAREIEAAHPGHGKGYKPAAKHRRGVTAWVEAEGMIALGDTVRLHVPPRRLYPHLPG